jgi:hypothetical protein
MFKILCLLFFSSHLIADIRHVSGFASRKFMSRGDKSVCLQKACERALEINNLSYYASYLVKTTYSKKKTDKTCVLDKQNRLKGHFTFEVYDTYTDVNYVSTDYETRDNPLFLECHCEMDLKFECEKDE